MIYIFSGTYRQAEHFARECRLSPREYRYISDIYMVKGLRDIRYKRIGTWHERKDVNEIQEYLNIIGAKEI